LRVFENRVLRRIFGPKREDVTGCCRKLHNEAVRFVLFAQYYSSDLSKVDEIGGACGAHGGGEGCIQNFGWEA
jgi:hypothetical protein